MPGCNQGVSARNEKKRKDYTSMKRLHASRQSSGPQSQRRQTYTHLPWEHECHALSRSCPHTHTHTPARMQTKRQSPCQSKGGCAHRGKVP
eukprot:1150903-Pelagomonas_calceolata.AAC.7